MNLIEIIIKSFAIYMVIGIVFVSLITLLVRKKSLASKHFMIGIAAFGFGWPFFMPILCHGAISDKQFERVLQNACRYHGNLGIVESSCLSLTSGLIFAYFIFGYHLF